MIKIAVWHGLWQDATTMKVVHRNSPSQIMLSLELVLLQGSSPLLKLLPSLFTLPLPLFLCILSLPPPPFFPFVKLDEGSTGFGMTVEYGPRSSVLPVRTLGDRVLEDGDRRELLPQILDEHKIVILGKICVVMSLRVGVTLRGGSVEAFMFEELGK